VPSAALLSDSIYSITTLLRTLNNVPEETAKHVKRYYYDTLYYLATSLKLDKINVAKVAKMLIEYAYDSKLIKLA
jgi:negative regulator of genetic competence, sporulation and motility